MENEENQRSVVGSRTIQVRPTANSAVTMVANYGSKENECISLAARTLGGESYEMGDPNFKFIFQ